MTVGMEILTVPLTEQLRGTLQLVLFLAGGLLLIFVVAYVTLSIVFDSALVRPLSALATAADAASQTGEPELHRAAIRCSRNPCARRGAGAYASEHDQGHGGSGKDGGARLRTNDE